VPDAVRQATRFEVDDGVAWLTLHRPDAANARNQQMRDELARTYAEVSADPAVRVLVLTGAGEKVFCAGMDLKEAGGPETPVERRSRLRSSRDIEQLARLPIPTIAAINGHALGGGLEMALACDLRIVADGAQMGLPEVTLGLLPGGGGTLRLPRLVGVTAAFELLYTGRRLSAAEARDLGLVNAVVPLDRLEAEALDLARRIASGPAPALRAVKEAVLAGLHQPPDAAADRELDLLLTLIAERDRNANT
jgi:enoyl-CoA hydratase/carnithine racemase